MAGGRGAIFELKSRLAMGLVLDGGLATELERRGHDLQDPLWSARVLLEEPEAVRAVHRDYLKAGAQCLTTASYQASLPGLMRRGLSFAQAREVFARSIDLASEAIQESDQPALVAASLGPYGAYLANGAEFHGEYGISRSTLREFHAERLDLLIASEPDILACETIPSQQEAEVLAELIAERAYPAWISFSCRDEAHICHGEPVAELAAMLDEIDSVVAIGVNCTAPKYVESLIMRIRQATQKPIVVYPNSGQVWNSATRSWEGQADHVEFIDLSKRWRRAGASGIGGCCQTTPAHISGIAAMMEGKA